MFEHFSGTESYIASAELREAVNVALALERPLLIKGEPGYRQNAFGDRCFRSARTSTPHLARQEH